MKIKKTTTRLSLKDFHIGQILRWRDSVFKLRDFVFLFDVFNPALVQLSSSYQLLGRWRLDNLLEGIGRIDCVFFSGQFFLISDSSANTLYRLEVDFAPNGTLNPGEVSRYPQPPGSVYTALHSLGDGYIMLDKSKSLLRVLGPDFQEKRTRGSRMGYFLGHEENESTRLGFEFPEDLLVVKEKRKILVSDSGNKRLVVVDEKWQPEKVFPLPENPYKILFYRDDVVVVSDFNRSLMAVSLEYGFIHCWEMDYAVDFMPSFCGGVQSFTGTEHGPECELAELALPELGAEGIETLSREVGNHPVLMRVLIAGGRFEEASQLALQREELLPHFARYTAAANAGEALLKKLSAFVVESFEKHLKETETLKVAVMELGNDFIDKYNAIPNARDKEAAQIEREHVKYRIYRELKGYRDRLSKIIDLRRFLADYPRQLEQLNGLFEQRFQWLEQALLRNEASLSRLLTEMRDSPASVCSPELLNIIIDYWFCCEEERSLFRDKVPEYDRKLGNEFLPAMLDNYNLTVARLYQKDGMLDGYIKYADREVSMFPDKVGIFNQFITQLQAAGKYDDVLRMLDKFPDRNKENVNFFYYRVYQAKGEADKAFGHLKRELELFPHRIELIPQLLNLQHMFRREIKQPIDAQAYINKLLEKAGQGIDVYLNIAEAFRGIGDLEKAKLYVRKELEFFPESQSAIALALKLELESPGEPDKGELRKLVDGGFTNPYYMLLRSRVYYILEDYKKCWNNYKEFLRTNLDERNANWNSFLMGCLNYVVLSDAELQQLKELARQVKFDSIKTELMVYLSFLASQAVESLSGPGSGVDDISGGNQDAEPEGMPVCTAETYLAAYSTAVLAYNRYFDRIKQLRKNEKWDKMFSLVETVLKYNPGDNRVFEFLDALVEA